MADVRSVLYLIRKPPGVLANEMLDLILVSGVFEQPTSEHMLGARIDLVVAVHGVRRTLLGWIFWLRKMNFVSAWYVDRWF